MVGESVSVKQANGKVVAIPLKRFSAPDQKFINEWKAANKGTVPPHLKNKKPRLDMRVSNGRTSKSDDQLSGFVDEKKQKLRISATLENNDAVYPIVDAKLTMLMFGRSPETGDDAVVYRVEFKDIELPFAEEKVFRGEPFELWYDDEGAMYGFKYRGYVAVLKDPEGKVLGEVTQPSSAAKYLANVTKLKTGDVFDNTYKKSGTVRLTKSVKPLK